MSASGALNLLIYVIIFVIIIAVLLWVLKFFLGVLFITPTVSAIFPAYTETGNTFPIGVIDADTSNLFSV